MNGLLALAFAAGMIAPVNPCGFALLPAWITYALDDGDTSPLPVRLARALRSGAALTVGFAVTLAAAGLVVSAGARPGSKRPWRRAFRNHGAVLQITAPSPTTASPAAAAAGLVQLGVVQLSFGGSGTW